MYFGDKAGYPFFFGMGFAGGLIENDQRDDGGLFLPESAIAKLPKVEKREIGFHATQARVQQESNLGQH